MLKTRLQNAKDTYQREFEILAQQYESALSTIASQKSDILGLQTRLEVQEQLISQFQNLVEAAGRDYLLKEQGQDLNRAVEGVAPIKILDYINEMNDDEDNIALQAKNTFEKGDLLLNHSFDFYGTALSLNSEQQIDLANRNIVRFYKMKVNQLYFDIEGLQGELDATRSLV